MYQVLDEMKVDFDQLRLQFVPRPSRLSLLPRRGGDGFDGL